MDSIEDLLNRLTLTQYLERLVEAGFDTVAALDCMTEVDFEKFGVKLGHRRIFQRDQFRRNGGSDNQAIRLPVDSPGQGMPKVKRQYRRRPRHDANAPARPHSAYFAFASQIRLQNESKAIGFVDKAIGFVDLAKETGRQWREMSPTDKAAREAKATLQNQTYNARFQDYMKTDKYQQYQQYLLDFHQSQSMKTAAGFKSHHVSDIIPEIVGIKSNVTEDVNHPTRPTNNVSTTAPKFRGLKRAQDESDLPFTTVIKGRSEEHTPTTQTWSPPEVIMTLFISLSRKVLIHDSDALVCSDLRAQEEIRLLLGHTPFLPLTTAEVSQSKQTLENTDYSPFNPFYEFDNSVLQVYILNFLTHVNHLLYFFREDDLENNFIAASTIPSESSQTVTELCLVLAIGAKVHRPANLEVSSLCHTYGIVRMQQLEPREGIFVIRALALLSFYHMDEDLGISSHYLRAALSLGNYYGLDDASAAFIEFDGEGRSHWLRIWETIRVLYSLSLTRPDFELGSLQDPKYKLELYDPTPLTEHCMDDRIVQTCMRSISSIVREVITDSTIHGGMRSPVIDAHIININTWYNSVPKHLYLENDSRKCVANFILHGSDRNCIAMLHLRCLKLGTMGILLNQQLMATTRLRTSGNNIPTHGYVNQCLKSASDLIRLCSTMFYAGYFTLGSGILLNFIYRSALIILIGQPVMIGNGDDCSLSLSESKELLAMAVDILRNTALRSKACQRYLVILRHFNIRHLDGSVESHD